MPRVEVRCHVRVNSAGGGTGCVAGRGVPVDFYSFKPRNSTAQCYSWSIGIPRLLRLWSERNNTPIHFTRISEIFHLYTVSLKIKTFVQNI